jgi:hypothetical protein
MSSIGEICPGKQYYNTLQQHYRIGLAGESLNQPDTGFNEQTRLAALPARRVSASRQPARDDRSSVAANAAPALGGIDA